MFPRTAHFHRARVTDSLSNAEQKAKDWDRLEQIGKREPVETPKVHLWKLAHGGAAIYDEDRMVVIVAVAAPLTVTSLEQQIRATARACPHGSNLVILLFPNSEFWMLAR